MRFFFENNMATVAQVKEAGFFILFHRDPLWNNVLLSSQRERRVSRLNRTGKNTTGWARRLTALLVTACLVMAMALPVYAEVDLLPDAPDEVELLEDESGTASGENTALPEQNAATPEPEQSAEPEQPAPTETPEPTAEPTPTPEPAATATATPVPTVTPTATPEPTEQPQKMYAARSVDNVQAVSEGGVPATYTLYFAVPDGWSDCKKVKIHAIVGQNETSDRKYYLDMQEADKTDDGRKIYSAVLNMDDHYPNKGLGGLEFCGYNEDTLTEDKPTYKVTIVKVDNYNNRPWDQWISFDPTDKRYIHGNYYDGNKKGGWNRDDWTTYTVSHKHFAGKEMAFKNKTSEPLTDVQAWFYEPDENGDLSNVCDPISLNSDGVGSGIASGSTATFKIPDGFYSYVKFTWNEGNSPKSSKIYNFYGKDVSDEDKESFTYSDISNCFIYTGADNTGAVNGRWGIENSFCIYYDATFSKLPTTGRNDTDGDYSIPKDKQSTVYYRLKGDQKESIGGPMSRIKGTDYYVADVPDGYTEIVFSSYPLSDDNKLATCGDSTNWEAIPENYTEPCFYADTNDDAVYHKGPRGGYWAPKGTKRDAEEWKNRDAEAGKKTPIVDIASDVFTEEPNTKYVTSTLYDYYTDYELNGKNRDNYTDNDNKASHRNWVTFREFDQALSDYYSNSGTTVPYPMYTGQFQPDAVGADGNEWGIRFSEIADKLNLYGYTDKKRFMAVNNSTSNIKGEGLGKEETKLYDETFQGLAGPELKNGEPIMNGTNLAMPFFNEEFLQGENSKKAKLGNVYKEVSFPFTQDEVFKESDATNANEKGVKYWYFDSDKTTLYLKNDPDNGGYFLQKQNALESKSKNLKSDSTPVEVKNEKGETVKNEKGEPVYTYGFFPFNSGASEKQASTYNYGFGAKLQFQFTLTSDGTVKDNKGNSVPIKFFFSGDDDVWVYIDGKLALDVGGDHGKASGLLEFGADTNGNNYTSYVSDIKASNNTVYDSVEDKTVTYLGNKITFKYKSKETTTLKPGTHTLTMYYMERGMWESNMAVAFNFPDNNELQVQKQVVLKNVDPEFQKCFTDKKIFNFTIKNQATHYGTKDAAGPDESGTQSQKVDLTEKGGNTFEPATKQTESNKGDYIFELVDNPKRDSGPDSGTNPEQVLHWYARYPDTEPVSKYRYKRYGILTLNQTIDIKDMRFLTFQVYVSQEDGGELSLNNLYLELLDNQDLLEPPKSPGQKGSLGTTGINGATYGSVEMKTGAWVTVKLDLNKMKEQGNFNDNVKTIRVGDNYSRHIYFRNFTFIPKAVPSTMSGFTTDQKEIPDYKSATTGQLENAENAQYTSTKDTDTQLVGEDGRFVLEDGEIVTFSDQFRRGSYISLKEDLNQSLYDTTWTVYENGQAVTSTNPTSTGSASHVILGEDRQLDSKHSPAQEGPDDGRTEVYVNDEKVNNKGYTESKKPTPDNTIVFRSYKNPDDTSSLTKLKVKYVNTVKTGGLTIQKKAADGETLDGTYKFKVTFSDVGGAALEEDDIIRYVEIDMSDEKNKEHTGTITGIPIGTRYTIEEEKPEDGSRLQGVTVPPNCHSAQAINNNTMVEGVIEVAGTTPTTAIFTNTKRTLINIEFDKLWKDAHGSEIGTANQPDEIYIQLQRRLATSQNDEGWTPVNYPTTTSPDPNYVIIKRGESHWQFTFSGLDQYQINKDNKQTNYVYRIVEGTVKNGSFTQAVVTQAGETITIKGNTYVVTAKAEAKISDGDGTKQTTATVNGGTITGDSGTIVLTNKLQNPKFVLDIIKKDAEKGENNKDVPLGGVEFKLEKLVETTEGKTQVDTTYTGTTDDNGKIISNPFKDLEPGTYRLTETKAHPGYNLLAQPIVIEFTQDGKCSIDGVEVKKDGNTFKDGPNNTYTMTLTVLNRKTPELPHTGADAPSLWLLIGMPLAVAGLLIFTFRYNRKGGRRH